MGGCWVGWHGGVGMALAGHGLAEAASELLVGGYVEQS